jgi:hypothetical protein
MCSVHHVVLLAEETWIQIPAIITMHARPGDVCSLQYMHENRNFFAPGAANGPGLRRSSTFLISREIQRLLNSKQLALSLSGQTFLFATRKLGSPEALPYLGMDALCATLERAQFRAQM